MSYFTPLKTARCYVRASTKSGVANAETLGSAVAVWCKLEKATGVRNVNGHEVNLRHRVLTDDREFAIGDRLYLPGEDQTDDDGGHRIVSTGSETVLGVSVHTAEV